MRELNQDQLALIYMTTTANVDRVKSRPPMIPISIYDERMIDSLRESAERSAHLYDYYVDIVQLSVLFQRNFYHYICCDEASALTVPVNSASNVFVFSTEKELLETFNNNLLSNLFPETLDGIVVGDTILAGWKIGVEIWPIVVNKMLSYNLHIPLEIKADPSVRYNKQTRLFDLASIYSQFAWMSSRKIPALPDALWYWGERKSFVCPDDIRQSACVDSPEITAKMVETYLSSMKTVIENYYS